MGSIFRVWCLALILLLLCSQSWGSCSDVRRTTSWYNSQCGSTYDYFLDYNNSKNYSCSNTYVFNVGSCHKTLYYQIYSSVPVICVGTFNSVWDVYAQYITCSTQAEADSVYCAQNPTAEGCGNCKAADSTWLSNVVDSCNAVYGENNYSIVDTNDVCEHRGHCCPMDSTITGNACTWKCESVASQCQPPLNFYSGILLDTTVSDTGDVVQGRCYYNCINYVPSDTTKAMVSGNILLTGPVSVMSQGTKVPNAFNSVRITDSGTYIYDYLFPQAEHYVDSIVFTPCVKSLYRGILNGKYVYWYDGQTAPAGVTNIVKVK